MAIGDIIFNVVTQALDIGASRLIKRKYGSSSEGVGFFFIIAVCAIFAGICYYVFWLSEHQ